MKRLIEFFKKNDLSFKEILYKLIFPSIGKIIIFAGLGLVGVSLIEIIVVGLMKDFDVSIEHSNNPLWGFILILIGLGYELIKDWLDKKYNPNNGVVSQLKHIKEDFFNGEINNAITHLNEAKKEHNLNQNSLYEILMLETEIAFQLGNYEEVKENLDYIDTNFNTKLNDRFYQLKISIYALDKDKENYDKISIKLQKEFGSNQPKEYFEILFYLNSGEAENAKRLYDEYVQNNVENKLPYVGGLIYANLHLDTQDDRDLEKAELYYAKYLENNKPNFFEKLEIYKFYSRTAFNKLLLNHTDVEYKDKVENTKELLFSIKDSFHYFNHTHKKFLINHYLHCLYILDKEEFVNFYKIVDENIIDTINFGFQHLDIGQCIDREVIETRILARNEEDLLIHYLSRLVTIDAQRVTLFVEENRKYLENEIVLNIFLEANIRVNKTISEEEYEGLKSKKDHSIISYISYLEAKKINSIKIDTDEIETLLTLLDDNSQQEIIIIKVIRILSQNALQRKYIELALKYKNSFQNIISETLNVCANDRNLLLPDFDYFVEEIDSIDYSIKIANIYRSYFKISKAYEFYKIAWEHINFLDEEKIEFAAYVLHYCSLPYYFQNTKSINREQDSVYRSYLEEKYSLLSIEQSFILSFYSIVVEESYENGFLQINRKLLSSNINTLTEEEKELLTKLYFFSIVNKIDSSVDIKSNLLIKENDEYYISSELYSDIDENYLFKIIDQKEFELMLFRSGIEKLSIFHQICNRFIDNLESSHFRSVISTDEDPLSGIREMLHDSAEKGKQQLTDYSDGGYISFYNLANGEYKNYFHLINILLNSEDINFHAGENNPQPYEVNKILTFSSIVFLNKIEKLDIVLEREDVYIQQTTINWLLNFIKELDSSDELLSVYSDGENILKSLANKEDIEKDKEYLLGLAHKIIDSKNIVDDTESILQLKDSYEMFVPQIGEQEYRAIAYAYDNNYQIISEDKIISFMYKTMKLNTWMVSNSMSLLSNKLNMEELFELYKELDQKKYSNLFNESGIRNTLNNLIFEDPIYLLQWHKKKYSNFQLEELLHIVEKYGWLDWIKEYYRDNYILVPPRMTTKPRSYITSNIEYIFDLLGMKIKG